MQTTKGMHERKPRRTYTDEFKADAVRMVTEGGQKPRPVARSLGVDVASLKSWMRKLAPNWNPVQAEPSADPKVLAVQLREAQREVLRLRAAVEVLKKATAFFANPNL